MSILADRESRLFIDGKLIAGSGGTFETVNPATEEVLGVAANADVADMGAAIGAARAAFDDTDWSTNTELRVRCLRPDNPGAAELSAMLADYREDLADLPPCAARDEVARHFQTTRWILEVEFPADQGVVPEAYRTNGWLMELFVERADGLIHCDGQGFYDRDDEIFLAMA